MSVQVIRCEWIWAKELQFTLSCDSRDIEHDLKNDLKDICVIGFEPNPRHTASLQEIQEKYTKCGWSVRFDGFTRLGMGWVNFYNHADKS